MKNIFIIAAFLMLTVVSCNKDDEKTDTEKPVIDLSFDGTFPVNGSHLHFGEKAVVKFRLTDNSELGSFSINIHDNFDHHSHSTEEEGGEHHHHHDEDGEGDAFYFSKDYEIPSGQKEYIVNEEIVIPSASDDGDAFKGGDYHFQITVIDKAGWSSFKALEIEIE